MSGDHEDRAVWDPVGLITSLVTAAEPVLTAGQVREVVTAVAGGRAKSRRLALALASRPAVLADGRSPAPRAVAELLAALRAAGATTISPPRWPGAAGSCGLFDSKDSLQLYRTFANPEQTYQYPYMIAGPFSPLSFTQAPLFVTTFRPDEWVQKNAEWIAEHAREHGTGLKDVTLAALKNMIPGEPQPTTAERESGREAARQEGSASWSGSTRIRTSLPHNASAAPH